MLGGWGTEVWGWWEVNTLFQEQKIKKCIRGILFRDKEVNTPPPKKVGREKAEGGNGRQTFRTIGFKL